MNGQSGDNPLSVDVVIPVFNEKPSNLAETLTACLKQTYRIATVFVVDDGSVQPAVLPYWAIASGQVSLVRLPENRGISAARNAAIERSTAPLLACVNAEVLPDVDWLATCENYLANHPEVGACYTRIVPQTPNRILTRWRIRFHEIEFGEQSGPAEFAPGHAVLFRRTAVDSVSGYDVRYKRNHEDSDICRRMRESGWETHYVASSHCISMQRDSLKELAAKQLVRDTGSPEQHSLIGQFLLLTKWTMKRATRNIGSGRIYFLPIDFALWVRALWMAIVRQFHTMNKGIDGGPS